MEIVNQSATQIDTFLKCPRQWCWQKIAGLSQPPAKSLELGKRVHDILEAYYQKRGAPDMSETWQFQGQGKVYYPGRIASLMISDVIPAWAGEILQAELPFEEGHIGRAWGVVFRGQVDVHWVENRTLHIVDHKTSVDPKHYGKQDLSEDIQRILYSRVLLDIYPHVDRVEFSLNYGSTGADPKKNYYITHEATAQEVIDDFETKIVPVSKFMAEAKRQNMNPLELEPNAAHCPAFGGCEFFDRCELTTEQRIGALFMGEKRNFLAELQEKQKAKKGVIAKSKKTEVSVNPPEAETVAEESRVEEEEAPAKKPEVKKVSTVTKKKKAAAPAKKEEPKPAEKQEEKDPEIMDFLKSIAEMKQEEVMKLAHNMTPVGNTLLNDAEKTKIVEAVSTLYGLAAGSFQNNDGRATHAYDLKNEVMAIIDKGRA